MNREHRLILWNQLEILKHLNPSDRAQYDLNQQALSSGYTAFYRDIFHPIGDAEADEHMQQEVFDTLDMFRALDTAKGNGWTPSDPSRAVFQGYDGNNDDHYFFAEYVLGTRGLYIESASQPRDSHSAGSLPRYRQMLKKWNEATEKHALTNAEAEAIIS